VYYAPASADLQSLFFLSVVCNDTRIAIIENMNFATQLSLQTSVKSDTDRKSRQHGVAIFYFFMFNKASLAIRSSSINRVSRLV